MTVRHSSPEQGLSYYKDLSEKRKDDPIWERFYADPKGLMYYTISLGPDAREWAQEMVFINAANPKVSNEAWLHAGDRCGFGEEGEQYWATLPAEPVSESVIEFKARVISWKNVKQIVKNWLRDESIRCFGVKYRV